MTSNRTVVALLLAISCGCIVAGTRAQDAPVSEAKTAAATETPAAEDKKQAVVGKTTETKVVAPKPKAPAEDELDQPSAYHLYLSLSGARDADGTVGTNLSGGLRTRVTSTVENELGAGWVHDGVFGDGATIDWRVSFGTRSGPRAAFYVGPSLQIFSSGSVAIAPEFGGDFRFALSDVDVRPHTGLRLFAAPVIPLGDRGVHVFFGAAVYLTLGLGHHWVSDEVEENDDPALLPKILKSLVAHELSDVALGDPKVDSCRLTLGGEAADWRAAKEGDTCAGELHEPVKLGTCATIVLVTPDGTSTLLVAKDATGTSKGATITEDRSGSSWPAVTVCSTDPTKGDLPFDLDAWVTNRESSVGAVASRYDASVVGVSPEKLKECSAPGGLAQDACCIAQIPHANGRQEVLLGGGVTELALRSPWYVDAKLGGPAAPIETKHEHEVLWTLPQSFNVAETKDPQSRKVTLTSGGTGGPIILCGAARKDAPAPTPGASQPGPSNPPEVAPAPEKPAPAAAPNPADEGAPPADAKVSKSLALCATKPDDDVYGLAAVLITYGEHAKTDVWLENPGATRKVSRNQVQYSCWIRRPGKIAGSITSNAPGPFEVRHGFEPYDASMGVVDGWKLYEQMKLAPTKSGDLKPSRAEKFLFSVPAAP